MSTSLKSQAMLVSLSITKPKMTAKDHKATADAELANNAHGAGAYVKRLYPKHLIDPIVSVENEARGYVYSRTLPWNKGQQLLPSTRYMEFAAQMRKYETAFYQTVTAFLANYANVMQEAQKVQGTLFDASEYPDLSDIREQFTMRTRYFPLADASDFRLKVEAEVIEEIKREAEESMKDVLAESMQEPYRRLYEAVARIHTQCAKPESRIYDSLMNNLDELLDVLPDLNFVGDKKLDALLEECRASISVHPETLRTDPQAKQDVAERAKDILSKMSAFA
jgi:hypothetical protein